MTWMSVNPMRKWFQLWFKFCIRHSIIYKLQGMGRIIQNHCAILSSDSSSGFEKEKKNSCVENLSFNLTSVAGKPWRNHRLFFFLQSIHLRSPKLENWLLSFIWHNWFICKSSNLAMILDAVFFHWSLLLVCGNKRIKDSVSANHQVMNKNSNRSEAEATV